VVGNEAVKTPSGDANVDLVLRGLTDLSSIPDVMSPDVVWHFFGDIDGIALEHRGLDNVFSGFWAKLFDFTDGAFAVTPVALTAVGDQLVSAHLRITVGRDGPPVDAAAVYRVEAGYITEVWDIPARP
jgi:hypothetical protein